MGLIIQRINGQLIDISNYNLRLVEFDPDSPEYKTRYEEVEGADGAVDLGTTIGVRKLKARFKLNGNDMYHIVSLRNEIFKLFHSKEAFYIIDQRESEKRWLVKVDPYTISTLRYIKTELELHFVSSSPCAESFYSTQELNSDGYTFQNSLFTIFNAGDESVDPRSKPLLITFKGASDKLKIKNKTTGDEWAYNGKTTADDIIRLDRVRSTKNSLSIVRDTNKKAIQLNAGVNEFEITGATGAFSISFDFRFYYF
ncbi:phage tail family protein [Bacillus wiedmannii]|uniref:phage tail family protein n=1 Tax=Bacillus wiedmannii TaxID=1890302 RepID=UPI0021D23559|nr:phage tail family protein [Bacillus wiedmannii]MCU5706152.1 phage tail family protein [Bacillus wiedmannii]